MAVYKQKERGFSLIELLIVMVILGLLAALVGPRMFGKVGKSKQKIAKTQISLFETALDTYRLDVGKYPTTGQGMQALRANPGGVKKWDGPYLRKTVPLDPWGNPYQYFKIEGQGGGVGKMRKDHHMVPVNSDFDLYSKGKDGKSQTPFTAKASRDDIVRANNGRYIGLVSDY